MEHQQCFSFNSQVFAFWERPGSGGAMREVPPAGLAVREMEGPRQCSSGGGQRGFYCRLFQIGEGDICSDDGRPQESSRR